MVSRTSRAWSARRGSKTQSDGTSSVTPSAMRPSPWRFARMPRWPTRLPQHWPQTAARLSFWCDACPWSLEHHRQQREQPEPGNRRRNKRDAQQHRKEQDDENREQYAACDGDHGVVPRLSCLSFVIGRNSRHFSQRFTRAHAGCRGYAHSARAQSRRLRCRLRPCSHGSRLPRSSSASTRCLCRSRIS